MERTFDAVIEEFNNVISFVENELETAGVSFKVISQVGVCVDEIFTNISSYAYKPETGSAKVKVEILEDPTRVELTFIDQGKHFNPLEKDDPDVNLSAEEREIGGLGIFMVKKLMDDVSYEYKDGKNILTIIKNI